MANKSSIEQEISDLIYQVIIAEMGDYESCSGRDPKYPLCETLEFYYNKVAERGNKFKRIILRPIIKLNEVHKKYIGGLFRTYINNINQIDVTVFEDLMKIKLASKEENSCENEKQREELSQHKRWLEITKQDNDYNEFPFLTFINDTINAVDYSTHLSVNNILDKKKYVYTVLSNEIKYIDKYNTLLSLFADTFIKFIKAYGVLFFRLLNSMNNKSDPSNIFNIITSISSGGIPNCDNIEDYMDKFRYVKPEKQPQSGKKKKLAKVVINDEDEKYM